MFCASRRPVLSAIPLSYLLLATTALAPAVLAGPELERVAAGHASVSQPLPGKTIVRQAGKRAIVEWRSFDVPQDHHVHFDQAMGIEAVTLNRVTAGDGTDIHGRITAPGNVWVSDPRGVLVGPDATIDVGGFVATTADVRDDDFMAERDHFAIDLAEPGAAVVNEGTISLAERGFGALVAPHVRNTGTIVAHLGQVELAGATTFTLDLHGGGLVNFATTGPVTERLADAGAVVEQTGEIVAPGGRVRLSADVAADVVENVINMEGVTTAQSVREQNGVILIGGPGAEGEVTVSGTLDVSGYDADTSGGRIEVTGERVRVPASAEIHADGPAGGGLVLVGGGERGQGPIRRSSRTDVEAGSRITARATDLGDGGRLVLWSDGFTDFAGSLDASAGPVGGDGGFIEISGKQGFNLAGEIVIDAPFGEPGTLLLDPATLTIVDRPGPPSENANIAENSDPRKLLEPSPEDSIIYSETLESLGDVSVILEADNAISIESDVNFPASDGRSITLNVASEDGVLALGKVSSTVSTNGGDISMSAGSVEAGLSSVRSGGGKITITTRTGLVDVASANSTPTLASDLSDGGAITITAAGDINVDSISAVDGKSTDPALPEGLGGDVSLIADGEVVVGAGIGGGRINTSGAKGGGSVGIAATAVTVVTGENGINGEIITSSEFGRAGDILIGGYPVTDTSASDATRTVEIPKIVANSGDPDGRQPKITIDFDEIDIGTVVFEANGASVRLASATDGRPVSIGGPEGSSTDSSLDLTAAELDQFFASDLNSFDIGPAEAATERSPVLVTGDMSFGNAKVTISGGAGLEIGPDLTFTGKGELILEATSTDAELNFAGPFTRAGGPLTLRGSNLVLTAGNELNFVDVDTVTLASTQGSLFLGTSIDVGDGAVLIVTPDLTQAEGSKITAGSVGVSVTADDATIDLNLGAPDDLATLPDGRTLVAIGPADDASAITPPSVTITSDAPLTVGSVNPPGMVVDDVTIDAGQVVINDEITATGNVEITINDGPTLNFIGPGGLGILADVTAGAAGDDGTVTIQSTGPVVIGDGTAPVTVSATTGVSITAGTRTAPPAGLPPPAPGIVYDQSLELAQNATVSTARGPITLQALADATLDGLNGLEIANDLTVDGTIAAVGTDAAGAPFVIDTTGRNLTFGTDFGIGAGALTVVAEGGTTIDGTLTVPGALRVQSGGLVTVNGNEISAADGITLDGDLAFAAELFLTSSNGPLEIGDNTITGTGGATLAIVTEATPFDLAGGTIASDGPLLVQAAGMSQAAAGVIDVTEFTIKTTTADNVVSLDGANDVGQLAIGPAPAGAPPVSISLSDTSAIEIATLPTQDGIEAAGDVSFSAGGSIEVLAPVTTTGTLTLTAETGDISAGSAVTADGVVFSAQDGVINFSDTALVDATEATPFTLDLSAGGTSGEPSVTLSDIRAPAGAELVRVQSSGGVVLQQGESDPGISGDLTIGPGGVTAFDLVLDVAGALVLTGDLTATEPTADPEIGFPVQIEAGAVDQRAGSTLTSAGVDIQTTSSAGPVALNGEVVVGSLSIGPNTADTRPGAVTIANARAAVATDPVVLTILQPLGDVVVTTEGPLTVSQIQHVDVVGAVTLAAGGDLVVEGFLEGTAVFLETTGGDVRAVPPPGEARDSIIAESLSIVAGGTIDIGDFDIAERTGGNDTPFFLSLQAGTGDIVAAVEANDGVTLRRASVPGALALEVRLDDLSVADAGVDAGSIDFTVNGDLTLDAPLAAPNGVVLIDAESVRQALGAPITAAALGIETTEAGEPVALVSSGNSFDTLAIGPSPGVGAPGDLTIIGAGDVLIGQVNPTGLTSAGNIVVAFPGTIEVAAPITAGGAVSLRSTAGSITSTAPATITGASALLEAPKIGIVDLLFTDATPADRFSLTALAFDNSDFRAAVAAPAGTTLISGLADGGAFDLDTSGPLTVGPAGISAGTVRLTTPADQPFVLAGPIDATPAAGNADAVIISVGSFDNEGGTIGAGSGRFIVYSEEPEADDRTGLDGFEKRYNVLRGSPDPFGSSANLFLYDNDIQLTVAADDVLQLGRRATPFGFFVTGLIDGDTLANGVDPATVQLDPSAAVLPPPAPGDYPISIDLLLLVSPFNYELIVVDGTLTVRAPAPAPEPFDGDVADDTVPTPPDQLLPEDSPVDARLAADTDRGILLFSNDGYREAWGALGALAPATEDDDEE